jgi:hypothetical protein
MRAAAKQRLPVRARASKQPAGKTWCRALTFATPPRSPPVRGAPSCSRYRVAPTELPPGIAQALLCEQSALQRCTARLLCEQSALQRCTARLLCEQSALQCVQSVRRRQAAELESPSGTRDSAIQWVTVLKVQVASCGRTSGRSRRQTTTRTSRRRCLTSSAAASARSRARRVAAARRASTRVRPCTLRRRRIRLAAGRLAVCNPPAGSTKARGAYGGWLLRRAAPPAARRPRRQIGAARRRHRGPRRRRPTCTPEPGAPSSEGPAIS